MAAGPDSRESRSERARAALGAVGQEHVLRFLPQLSDVEADHLLGQIESLDLERLARLIKQVLQPAAAQASELHPPEVAELGRGDEHAARDREAREAGEARLAAGKVAAFLVAGGQGTRLGFEGPKGRFPVGPLTNRSLFAYHAHRVLATSRRYGVDVPFYIMTSQANHQSTLDAFDEAGFFGLERQHVRFFQQGMLPAVDPEGRLLLARHHALSMSPDGHGGCFAAMERSGSLDDMERRGIEDIFYFQVDNPLARVLDPVFVGHHALARAQMSTKVVEKSDPDEKVGVLARRASQTCLVEYSDLDQGLARARDPDQRLSFRAGNIAIHMLDLAFVRQLRGDGGDLPVHRADKRVPFVDAQGRAVQPAQPNAIKMEMFVFDALPLAERVVTQEVRRDEEFAPVKNAEGADSPHTARAALAAQALRWIQAAGLAPPSGPAEVGPLFALDQEAFCANLTRADFGPVFDRS